jgi:hypothetical protein
MRTIPRLAGGLALAVVLTPWLAGSASAGASKSPPPSGDERATSYSGNVTTCGQIGLGDATQLGDDGSGALSQDGFVVGSDGQNLDVTAVPADKQILALVVKGGDGFNLYGAGVFTSLPASGLHAPLVGNPPKNIPTISHWFLCYGPADENPPPVFVAPTASIDGTCSGATLTLDAGSDDTTFTISRAGDNADTTQDVTANGEGTAHVDLDADHPSVTVSADETELGTFTRSGDCDTTPPESNPTVSFSHSCKGGIGVTLGNMDGTAPATFTVTTPSGTVQHVQVRPESIVRKSYTVKEDTTGVVKVVAPGLNQRAFSYHKNCTTVLGEKVVKTPKPKGPAVLPFTGSPTDELLGAAAMSVGVGMLLTVAARRRRRARVTS